MTVPTEAWKAEHSWTGVETSFTPGFTAGATTDVKVYSKTVGDQGLGTLLTVNVHYTVALGVGNAVTVTPVALPAAPKTITILRDTPATQSTDFQNLGGYSAAVHTQLHDAHARLAAELKGRLDEAVVDLTNIDASVDAAAASAVASEASNVASAAAAAESAAQAARLAGTSTSSVSIGTGSKSFTTQAGKAFEVGRDLIVTSDANPTTHRMAGRVTAYSGTSLTIDVEKADGAGTRADWTIRVSGGVGNVGPAGPALVPDRVAITMDTTDSDPSTTGYNNAASIGGKTVATGQKVFRNASGHPERNGLWTVSASGPAARDDDFDTYDEHVGIEIAVAEGTSADTMWLCTSNAGGTINVTAITFTQTHPQPDNSITAAMIQSAAVTPVKLDAGTAAKQDDFRATLATDEWDYLINGNGQINQRAPASNADDTYGHDRWIALTQANAIAVSTLDDQEDGTPKMMRLTQSNAGAQRIGYAQIMQASDSKRLRGKQVTFGGRMRHSLSANIRFAILEWTGTADSLTSDVVNDWSNGSFTAGGFFLGSNLTVRQVAVVAATSNVFADFLLTGTIGSTANNIIVMYWTENTTAQNNTLDVAAQFKRGTHVLPRLWRPEAIERGLCEWFFEELLPEAGGSKFEIGAAFNANTVRVIVRYARKRGTPSLGVPGAAGDYDVGDIVNAPQACTSVPALVTGSLGVTRGWLSFTKTGHGITANAFAQVGRQNANGRIFIESEL